MMLLIVFNKKNISVDLFTKTTYSGGVYVVDVVSPNCTLDPTVSVVSDTPRVRPSLLDTESKSDGALKESSHWE